MKSCYLFKDTRVIADLVAPFGDEDYYTLTRLNVPLKYRGRLLGSKMLTTILADADKEGVAIRLVVQPSGGLDYDQLISWYERYGFVQSPEGWMRREPHSQA